MAVSEAFQRKALEIIGKRNLAKEKKSPRWRLACAYAIERLPLNAAPPAQPHITYIIKQSTGNKTK
jgi:hypothetical protein